MTKDEAMKIALEALKDIHQGNMTPMAERSWNKAITAPRQALEQPKRHVSYVCPQCYWTLEQPEQKPVAWYYKTGLSRGVSLMQESPDWEPLYTAPSKREWVGLTDDEIDYIWGITKPDYEDLFDLPRAIEAKLKEKNQ